MASGKIVVCSPFLSMWAIGQANIAYVGAPVLTDAGQVGQRVVDQHLVYPIGVEDEYDLASVIHGDGVEVCQNGFSAVVIGALPVPHAHAS